MDTQRAIAKVLQDFTAELLKVFSAAVVDAVSQVSSASRAAGATSEVVVATPKRGRPRKDAPKAAPAKQPRKAAKAARVVKSTPEQVSRLGERIVALLQKASRNLSAKEVLASLKLSEEDEGRFQYALGKLKESGEVVQHGERRDARYGVGGGANKAKAKRGPGRPRKVPAASAEAESAAAPAESAENI
jgi:hypothetical protein